MLKPPPYLKKGDTIAILSTAKKISQTEIQPAIDIFESWGLNLVLGQTIGAEHHQFAGDDNFRAQEFQNMLNNSSIKAIICARGGYGTVRMLDKNIDFTKFTQKSKWIVGYSDVTALHAHINTYLYIQTLHATMPINFAKNTADSLETLRQALFGESYSIKFEVNNLNRLGNVEGEIVGGNLSILYSILGTKSGFNADGKILFIEDLDEYLYHIDRMMMALKRAGKLNKLKAIIVGRFTGMKDNEIPFGKTVEEIILDAVREFDYPVCFGFPSGHTNKNMALYFGKKCSLQIDNKDSFLKF